jgi:hypothetical protein
VHGGSEVAVLCVTPALSAVQDPISVTYTFFRNATSPVDAVTSGAASKEESADSICNDAKRCVSVC